MPTAKILVVEDEPVVARHLRHALTNLGYEVMGVVGEGDHALRLAEQQRPDLVLMDIILPGAQDGIATATVLNSRFDVPVIFLTAYADDSTVQRAKIAEPGGYLVKPYDESQLRAVIEIVLSRYKLEQMRRQLEAQQCAAERLKSLMTMAGGVAHDFNNLLTIILGYSSLGASLLPAESPVLAMMTQIEYAARRAGDLSHQLLAFTGKSGADFQPVYLSQLVEEQAPALRTLLAGRAELELFLANDLPAIRADAFQLRKMLTNLVINAGEALPSNSDTPGAVSIRTETLAVDRSFLSHCVPYQERPEGKYVSIKVADTGCGMDGPTRERIFEPFFTTKYIGRGMGLAAVLGIVQAHRGAVKVDSMPQNGSTFRVLLPPENQPF